MERPQYFNREPAATPTSQQILSSLETVQDSSVNRYDTHYRTLRGAAGLLFATSVLSLALVNAELANANEQLSSIETTTPTTVNRTQLLIDTHPGINPVVAEQLAGVKLTLDGYKAFLQTINTSPLQHTKQFPEFDKDRVKIKQGKTEFITWHFFGYHTESNLDVNRFTTGLARRGDSESSRPDHICCGINVVVANNGTHQTASIGAKLRHNKGYDQNTIGIEIQAASQADINTLKYERTAYASIAMLKHQEMLDVPVEKSLKGHGETRKAYNHAHPGNKLDGRSDFDKPESDALRAEIGKFLKEHTEIKNIPVNLA